MRNISIYLLKSDVSDVGALRGDASPSEVKCTALPEAKIFLCDSFSRQPWWVDYLGVEAKIAQQMQGAVLIIKVEDARFAITFGQGYRLLDDSAYECDFGIICTLNSVDPSRLKSVDSVQPSDAKRRRVQMPKDSILDVFDVLRSESVLRQMAGLVKAEYADLFKTITGSCNARISTNVDATQLPMVCKHLLSLYKSEGYRQVFPALRNVMLVKDPEKIQKLDSLLCDAIRNHDENLLLSVPEIVQYGGFAGVRFDAGKIYSLVVIESLWGAFGEGISGITVDRLRKHHHMALVDEEGAAVNGPYSLYKCLVWDCESGQEHYHLCDGLWYQIDANFLSNLNNDIHDLFENSEFPANNDDTEGGYNKAVSRLHSEYLCVDKNLIQIANAGSLEPCDLFRMHAGLAELIHVKIGVTSSRLSHLFNQGGNSIELLLTDNDARRLFIKKISGFETEFVTAVKERKIRVVFLIITKKDPALKEKNLPFFSRMSLRRVARMLLGMNVKVSVQFVHDNKQLETRNKRRRTISVGSTGNNEALS